LLVNIASPVELGEPALALFFRSDNRYSEGFLCQLKASDQGRWFAASSFCALVAPAPSPRQALVPERRRAVPALADAWLVLWDARRADCVHVGHPGGVFYRQPSLKGSGVRHVR
jgi:hypothetical protein